ncbi:MAG: aminotransferase class V-fold PLP-dependent enzyme [Vicinamibacterales bacterium]
MRSVKTILLNPGPVNVSARVREALNGPDLCHREPEYFDLQDAIRARLLQVFDAPVDEYSSVLLTGSGTAMVEAMVSSGVSANGRLLVVQNGVYGERIAAMARLHGIAYDVLEYGWTERPELDAIGAQLRAGRYEALAIVHHETTTGLLNDLAAVAALCRRAGVRVLVDAVSALGGEPFNFRDWRPDAVACTANKCVQGLPGLSFALVRRDFARAMAGFPERSLYLHLPRHHDEQERRSTPFTPAVQVGYALRAALDELAEETVASRIARYGRASAIVREGIVALGFELLLPPSLRSNTMTAIRLPRELSYGVLHDALRRAGFVIYAGQGPLAATLFRVATMGDVTEGDYRRFVQALGMSVESEKGKVKR